eukprot:SAG22_NODE_1271_length_4929_cov_4.159420_5_plen_186_part_00
MPYVVVACRDSCMEGGDFFDQSTGLCSECPFADRCKGGQCVEGSAGASCAACCTENSKEPSCPGTEQWYQAGQGCVKCAGSGGQVFGWALGGAAIVLLVVAVWKISRVEDGEATAQEKAVKAQETVEDTQGAAELAQRLSNTSLATSIVLSFAQFSLLALVLPFRMPVALQEFAYWLSSLVNVDL